MQKLLKPCRWTVKESKKNTFSTPYFQARPFGTIHHRESRRHENQSQDLILTVFVIVLFDILLVKQTLTSRCPKNHHINVFTQGS